MGKIAKGVNKIHFTMLMAIIFIFSRKFSPCKKANYHTKCGKNCHKVLSVRCGLFCGIYSFDRLDVMSIEASNDYLVVSPCNSSQSGRISKATRA